VDAAVIGGLGVLGGVLIGALGGFFAQAYVKRKGTFNLEKQLQNSKEIAEKQLKLNIAIKKSEFRQDWINSLRHAMSKFHSYGVSPHLDQTKEREFYELGTKIELMMNRKDERHKQLVDLMYRFLSAEDESEKYGVNPEYIETCQDILKQEWEVLKKELDASLATATR
jgi:hypothetical protein